MGNQVNIYCDESCHLEHDGQQVMVIGGVSCPKNKAREIASRLREIKLRHGYPSTRFEAKWSKVSPAGVQLYTDLVDYFFDDDDLHFRAIVVPDKSVIDHQRFSQDHDTWYYKMYYHMLVVLLDPRCEYRIYLDIKDTQSAAKIRNLHEVLSSTTKDYERKIVQQVQTVRSDEVEQLQLADILIGAVCFANRTHHEGRSPAKLQLVERVKKRSRYSLTGTTLLRENKFNLLNWHPGVGPE